MALRPRATPISAWARSCPKLSRTWATFTKPSAPRAASCAAPCGALPIFKTELGIEFVAMKRNIADLPAVLELGKRFDARRFIITNVLPYTKEMSEQALYHYMQRTGNSYPQLSLPRMQDTGIPEEMIARETHAMNVTRAGCDEQSPRDRCPFIAVGAGAISWDGNLSPCLPLMHTHTSYLVCYQRYSKTLRRRQRDGEEPARSVERP